MYNDVHWLTLSSPPIGSADTGKLWNKELVWVHICCVQVTVQVTFIEIICLSLFAHATGINLTQTILYMWYTTNEVISLHLSKFLRRGK